MAAKAKCANRWCLATRHHHEGKLFRLDLDIGSKAGGAERRTEYMWLCPNCARQMHPKVEVNGNTVTVRLSKKETMPPVSPSVPPLRVWLN
jgi:hypothetical protein